MRSHVANANLVSKSVKLDLRKAKLMYNKHRTFCLSNLLESETKRK